MSELKPDLRVLFAAHHTDPAYLTEKCRHYYCHNLSLAVLDPSPSVPILPLSHRHREYEFVMPRGQMPMFVCDGASYLGESGYCYPVQSNRVHGLLVRQTNCAWDHIVVRPELMDFALTESGHGGASFTARFPVNEELKTYLSLFRSEFENEDDPGPQKLNMLAYLICSELVRLGISAANERPDRGVPRKGIYGCVDYINKHYFEELNLDQLAQTAGLTKTYFVTAFKNTMGETPHSYINMLRLSYAKVFLELTDESIQSIAAKCGFDKPNSFRVMFKKNAGISPSEYRQSVRREA
ncbi:MAG: helix-turn-helix transcriptional regulator [Firmicutes bacterium]|nr:helix-turn-helix transcriptional regulator [Bacillota bacterium]